MKLEAFLELEQPEAFDFRQTTMDFHEETELGKFLEYKLSKGTDTDRCKLILKVYHALWADQAVACGGETMNSVLTTLNQVCLLHFKENLHVLKALEAANQADELSFKFPDARGRFIWSKERCRTLYSCGEDIFQKLLSENANRFLKAAYTIGNFTVIPEGCNPPRGTGPIKDYWDLTLYYIWKWYEANQVLSVPDHRMLLRIFNSLKPDFPNWLASFGTWGNFVEKNYMQDFVCAACGRPKELWKGHFAGPVLPTAAQAEEFFKNAAEWITARGERMVKALREKRSQ